MLAEDVVAVSSSTMDAAFEEQLKEGAEAFEFQAEVRCRSWIMTRGEMNVKYSLVKLLSGRFCL